MQLFFLFFFFPGRLLSKLPFETCNVGDPTTSTRNPALCVFILTGFWRFTFCPFFWPGIALSQSYQWCHFLSVFYQRHHSFLIFSVAVPLCETDCVLQLFIWAAGWALRMFTRLLCFGQIPPAVTCRTTLLQALQPHVCFYQPYWGPNNRFCFTQINIFALFSALSKWSAYSFMPQYSVPKLVYYSSCDLASSEESGRIISCVFQSILLVTMYISTGKKIRYLQLKALFQEEVLLWHIPNIS